MTEKLPRSVVEPKNPRLNVSRGANLPHVPGIRVGDYIFLSGMGPIDPRTGERNHGPIAEQIRTTLSNMRHMLESADSSLERVVRVHVLPNVLGPILVYATTLVSVSMILAAGLSFIGLGVKPPDAEWGLMLNTLRSAIYTQPLLATLPGICIFMTSICFNLTSDGLRAAMDVRG